MGDATVQKLGWHNSQVMPNLKASMRDATVHSISVVVVLVSVRGRTIPVSTKYR